MSPMECFSQVITPEIKQWIVEQARAGCRPEDVLQAMLQSGWQESVAIQAMEESLETYLKSERGNQQELILARAPLLDAAGSMPIFHCGDRKVQIVANMKNPQLVLLDDFLSAAECEEMIDKGRDRLARSETVVNETGDSQIHDARTSQGMFFQRGENDLCMKLEARISNMLGAPIDHGEGLQILRYGLGAEYKPHYDYFDPSLPGSPSILRRGGQRVATVLMYLNTPKQGGATVFPDAGLDISAVRGRALVFFYPVASPASRTLHGGAPVLDGEKWVATKWIRQSRFE